MEKTEVKISIWGFCSPTINSLGECVSEEWVLFNRPLWVEQSEYENLFSSECRKVRIFTRSMQKEAEEKSKEYEDFYSWYLRYPPKDIWELYNLYLCSLDPKIRSWVYIK